MLHDSEIVNGDRLDHPLEIVELPCPSNHGVGISALTDGWLRKGLLSQTRLYRQVWSGLFA